MIHWPEDILAFLIGVVITVLEEWLRHRGHPREPRP
jgi:hypothetical protein